MNKYRITFKTCHQYLFTDDVDVIDIVADTAGHADIMALDIIKVLERYTPDDSVYQIYDYAIKQID